MDVNLKRTDTAKAKYLIIAEHIEEQIKTNSLKPGDQLLSERELSEAFKVSRGSVRKALAVLEGSGLIETSHRGGSLVKEIDLQSGFKPMLERLPEDYFQLQYIFEVRHAIELNTVKLAAQRRENRDLANLWTIQQNFEQAIKEQQSAQKYDASFHIAIAQASHNPLLSNVLMNIVDFLMKSTDAALEQALSSKSVSSKLIEGHAAIIRAIEKQDANEAVKQMQAHLDYSSKYMNEVA